MGLRSRFCGKLSYFSLAAPFGIEVPQADTTVMLPVLMGMLGLAGARSYERVKQVGK